MRIVRARLLINSDGHCVPVGEERRVPEDLPREVAERWHAAGWVEDAEGRVPSVALPDPGPVDFAPRDSRVRSR